MVFSFFMDIMVVHKRLGTYALDYAKEYCHLQNKCTYISN